MPRNSLFDRFILLFSPESSGGIMDDEPEVELEDDSNNENTEDEDDDNGDNEEEDKEGEDEEEQDKDDSGEKDSKEEEPTLTRVEFKDIKAEFPTFFKKFPELKHAFFREQQFSEIFPTVEDARKAAESQNAYEEIAATVVEGNVGKFLTELKNEDENAVKNFSTNFLPALRDINKDLYFDIVAPQVQQFVKNVYAHGVKGKDNNIQNAAKIVHKVLFGGAYEDVEGEMPLMNGRNGNAKDDTVEKDKKSYFAGKYQNLFNEVTKECYGALEGEIIKGLDDLKKQPGLSKIIAKEVRERILSEMEKDTIYLGRMNSNWKKEERNGFSGSNKGAFLSLFLGKARTLIPKIRAEVRKETLGKDNNSEGSGRRESTRISGGGESRKSSSKMNMERVKKENLSTRQVFDD